MHGGCMPRHMCGLCWAQMSFTRHPRPFSSLLDSSGDSGPFTSGSPFFFFIFGGQLFLTLSPVPSPFPPYSISFFLPVPLPPSLPWPSHFSPPFILLLSPFILFSLLLLFLPLVPLLLLLHVKLRRLELYVRCSGRCLFLTVPSSFILTSQPTT